MDVLASKLAGSTCDFLPQALCPAGALLLGCWAHRFKAAGYQSEESTKGHFEPSSRCQTEGKKQANTEGDGDRNVG